jgi:putative ABC transport system permease protein
MRAPSPPLFRRRALSLRLFDALDQPTRILLRQIGRWPGRSLVTSLGIGMAIAVLVSSMMWLDSIDRIADVYFRQAQGQDVTVGFADPRPGTIVRELAGMEGVITAEPMRVVPAKIRFGMREERQSVQGLPAEQELHHVFDSSGGALTLPPEGLVISTMLAEMLGGAAVGDLLTLEVLEGRKPVLTVPVVGLFETYIGSPAYMHIGALNRLMNEQDSVTAVHLRLDPLARAQVFGRLKELPRVGFVTLKEAALRTFHDTLAQTLMIYVSFFVAFACILAFGVTYNAARIALSERGRELATLRVLGFTRAEISYILLGETGLLTVAALPLGCALGYALARLFVSAFKTELFRIPMVIEAATLGLALLIGLAASAFSALLVRRRVDRLDLIAVLKTRE